MKVFNLTDIETPLLKQHKMVNQTLAVGRALLAPGGSADVDETQADGVRAGMQHLVRIGALAVNNAPPQYVKSRELAAQPAVVPTSAPEPAPSSKATKA